MTEDDYNTEIAWIAEEIVDLTIANMAADELDDWRNITNAADRELNDTCDGHEWNLYKGHAHDIMCHSDNDEAFKEVMDPDSVGQMIFNEGIGDFVHHASYYAFRQDVIEMVEHFAKQYVAQREGAEEWD